MPRSARRFAPVSLVLIILAASLPAQDRVDPFYEKLVADGKEAFESKDFENTVQSFEVAFFGFLDNPPRLLECFVYLAVSYGELGNSEKGDYYLREIRRRKLDKNLAAANLPEDLLKRCGLIRAEPAKPAAANNGQTGAFAGVKVGDLIPIEEADSPPIVLESVKPVYPPLAFQSRREAEVTLLALISERGEVLDVKLAPGSSTAMGFSQAAEQALRRWTFKPATKNHVRVKVWKKVIITFKLKD